LIGIVKERAISILVLVKMKKIWQGQWDKLYSGADLNDECRSVKGLWGCSFYWVHSKLRGAKLVREMPDQACRLIGVTKRDFPLLWPFTAKGRRFFENYCPNQVTIGRLFG